MTQKLDSDNYNESETFTIKVPISLPYGSDSPDFERIDGHFEYNGEFYRTVKQRISYDTLTIVCVKDGEGKQIHQALISYVKTFTDKPSDNQAKSKTINTLSKDYFSQVVSIDQVSPGWSIDIIKETSLPDLQSSFYPSIILPPERI